VSFCNVFPHNFHKSQFFFLNHKNYLKKQAQVPQIKVLPFWHENCLKKQDLHWMFLPWLALQGLAFGWDWQLLSLDDVCLCFFVIGCFRTSWYFPPKSHLIVIFSLLWIFWLPLHSHSVLHDYCSIEAALVQYQILLKEVMLL